ncbi:MAG: hypothetical protein FJ138_06250 [Deltaproteobacteria bacterium]|nr:hypothetical protein [Deltaproteobacteria bacterium]
MTPPPPPAPPAPPARSASLILLALTAGEAGEACGRVLLLKRSPTASFMPSALVFPGGRLEPEDARGAAADEAGEAGEGRGWAAWGFDSPAAARAERRCAARETEEEAGLTLTAAEESAARCVGRWLTPARLPKRFHTSFWLLALPRAPAPRVDGAEVVEGGWWSPAEALSAYREGRVELAPPTIRLLHDLAALCARPALPALHAAALTGAPAPLARALAGWAPGEGGEGGEGSEGAAPICPTLLRDEARDLFALCLPGDEGYRGDNAAPASPTAAAAPVYRPAPSSPVHRLTRPLSDPKAPLRLVTSY